MTEFWVSQPKYYCKFCKCWLANNKASISHHESGKRHKEAQEVFFKEKREGKLQGARSESELDKELREIERRAREQAVEDAALFGQSLPMAPPPPPPRPAGVKPPPPPPRRDHTIGYKRADDADDEKEAAAEGKDEGEKGKYTVGDVTYLEGKHHEGRLVSGMACEIWVEAEDRWIPDATIVAVRETAVPNTTLVIRKFEIKYNPEEGTERDVEPIVEREVTADRLRIIDQPEAQVAVAPVIDEATGVGMWQTVSVRVVDEEVERMAALEQAMIDQMTRKENEAKDRMRLMEDALEGEDAMSSYDPYGKGLYKGVDLKATVEIAAEVDLGGDLNGPVAFRKKKRTADGANGAAKAKSRRRARDDET